MAVLVSERELLTDLQLHPIIYIKNEGPQISITDLLMQAHQWGPASSLLYLWMQERAPHNMTEWRTMFTCLGLSTNLAKQRNPGTFALRRLATFKGISIWRPTEAFPHVQIELHHPECDFHSTNLAIKLQKQGATNDG